VYLAEVAEYLLAHGHINALHYVMGQALCLYVLAGKRERAEMARMMGGMRCAYHAEDKAYKKTVDELT